MPLTKLFPKSKKSCAMIDEDAIEQRVVARFSRGNIRLQRGQYLTREDIDQRRERIKESIRRYGD